MGHDPFERITLIYSLEANDSKCLFPILFLCYIQCRNSEDRIVPHLIKVGTLTLSS